MIEKIIETGNKVDFHIHSIASKHKESDDCVDLSTLDNIDLLIEKLNQREIVKSNFFSLIAYLTKATITGLAISKALSFAIEKT